MCLRVCAGYCPSDLLCESNMYWNTPAASSASRRAFAYPSSNAIWRSCRSFSSSVTLRAPTDVPGRMCPVGRSGSGSMGGGASLRLADRRGRMGRCVAAYGATGCSASSCTSDIRSTLAIDRAGRRRRAPRWFSFSSNPYEDVVGFGCASPSGRSSSRTRRAPPMILRPVPALPVARAEKPRDVPAGVMASGPEVAR